MIQRNDGLTKEQELELGKKIQLMRVYTQEEDYDFDKLSEDERKIVMEGTEALEILVGNYVNLARDVAHKHHKKTGTRYELEDLLQDAISALIESAQMFDPSKDCRLSTYAYYGISKRVSSTINYQRPVRLPENKMGDYIKITKAQNEYRNFSDEEKEKYKSEMDYVYQNAGLKKQEIDLILQNMQQQISLNSALYENNGELIDTLSDTVSERDIKDTEGIDPKLELLLNELSDYERDLIAFEFNVFKPSLSFAEFMEVHDLTDKKVKSDTRRTITKLSNIAKRKKITITI